MNSETTIKRLFTSILLTVVLAISACSEDFLTDLELGTTSFGIGGMEESPINVSEGGVHGSGVIMGTITQITDGSNIVVTGIEIDTTIAEVIIEDQAATPADLEVGMYVNIEAIIDNENGSATALTITVEINFEGRIESIDLETKQITIFDQSINIDELTVFSHGGQENLETGYYISINGFQDEAGKFYARYIKLLSDIKPTPDRSQFISFSGIVSSMDDEKQLMKVDDYTVDYSQANFSVYSPSLLSRQVRIIAKVTDITSDLTIQAYGVIEVTGKIAGYATGIVSDINLVEQTFKLEGWTIRVYSGTDYIGIENMSQLEGRYISLRGFFSTDNTVGPTGELVSWLFAREIVDLGISSNTQSDEHVQVMGTIRSISTKDFEISNSALPVVTTQETVFEGGSALNIAPDITIEVKGSVTTDQKIRADSIRFLEASISKIEAIVYFIDLSNKKINLSGIPVLVDNYTMLIDNSHDSLNSFGLKNISEGDRLVVYGKHTKLGLTATRINRIK